MKATNQREPKSYLLDPKTQLKYALYFFAFSVIAAALNQLMLVRSLETFLLQALVNSNVDGGELAAAIAGPLKTLSVRLALLFPLLGLLCTLFAIRITHRFVGPQVALHRQIDALERGDYTAVCNLRKNDELKSIATALNELAVTLQERHEPATDTAPPEELAA